jgi:carbonic anhydrase
VVASFIMIGAHNNAFDPIFSNLHPDPENPVDLASFDLTGLLPSGSSSYRYTGLLTTSPFTEGVNWVVLAEVMEPSQNQVDRFQALFSAGNERELQALSGRMVLTDIVRMIRYSRG